MSKEEQLNDVKFEMLSALGEIILEFKDKHPNDTTLPFMRGKYNGEPVLTKKQENQYHKLKVLFNYHLKKIGKAEGIKTKISNHQSRHIFAQRLFLSGANIHYISMALGHSSLQITENYREQLVTDEAMDVTEEFSLTLQNT